MTRRRPLRTRTRTPRGLCRDRSVLLVVLLLLAQLLAGLHGAQEHHVVCPEHQEIEHLESAAALVRALDPGSSREGGASAVLAASDDASPRVHEACRLVPALSERATAPGATAATLVGLLVLVRSTACVDLRGHLQVALLRLAPKQSPPVRA